MEKAGKQENVLLFQTKTRIPEPPGSFIVREALIDGLLKGDEDVVVFQAGAGYGKTTVMAELARTRNGRCGWYRLNEADNKLYYFLNGFGSVFYGALTERIPIPEESGQKAEDIAEAYHRILSAFLLSVGNGIFYLCLDDFQIIKNEEIYRFIGSLIEYGQGKIRLFLTVKGSFPQFLTVYLMQGRVRIVGAEQLRFTKRETELLLHGMAGVKLAGQLAESIHTATEGWAAAIVFAGLALKEGKQKETAAFDLNRTRLNDYICYEIYRKLSDDMQLFLAETAVLEEPAAGICDFVLERSDSASIFEYLARECLFLTKQNDAEQSCRYHPLFAKFLKSRVSAERKEQICERAKLYAAHRKKKQRAKEKEVFYQPTPEKERRLTEPEEGSLFVRCLGQLEVSGTQGSIHFRTRKTKELFACLFFEGGRGVKKDMLLERLWPEQYGEKATVLFYTTVSYLRKALVQAGAPDVLRTENQSYRVDLSRIRSDIERLTIWSRWSEAGGWPFGEDVLETAGLYHECYLYGEDYPWLGAHREYVERVFLQTEEKLARLLMQKRRFGEAALLLEKAVSVNVYAMSHAELLTECLLCLGDIRGAKIQYEKMCTVCREELFLEPAVRFEDLIKLMPDR